MGRWTDEPTNGQMRVVTDCNIFVSDCIRILALNRFRIYALNRFRMLTLNFFRVFGLNRFRMFTSNRFRIFVLNRFRMFTLNFFRLFVSVFAFWEVAPEGTKSCRIQREPVHPICPCVCLSFQSLPPP